MEEFNKIHELLEGELDDSRQRELFLKLSQQKELRMDFKSLVLLNGTMKDKNLSLPIPLASSQRIFAETGIKSTTGKNAAAGFFKTRTFSAMAASFATALVFIMLFNPFADTAEVMSSENNFSAIQQETVERSNSNSDIGESSGKIDENQNSASNNVINSVSSKNISDNNSSDGEHSIISEILQNEGYSKIPTALEFAENSFNNEIEPEFPKFRTKESTNYSFLRNQKISSFKNQNEILDIGTKNSFKKFSIEARGFQDWMMPESQIGPSEIAKFHNTALCIDYRFSKNHSVGLDIRNENFLLKFSGENEFGMPVNYSVQPNLMSAGIYYRYAMRDAGKVFPIAQIYLGGNEIGGVARLMSGAGISIDNFEFVFGIEYSTNIFEYQGVIFNSSKIGLNYGVKYYIF